MKFRSLLLLFPLLVAACTSDVDGVYSNIRANFIYTNVLTQNNLRVALNNPGYFCSVTYASPYFYFGMYGETTTSADGTAIIQQGYKAGIVGLLLGYASLPTEAVVAYDMACPDCYYNHLQNQKLVFTSLNTVQCSKRGTTYDLNSGLYTGGTLGEDGQAKRLIRYRISYTAGSNVVAVQN